MHTDFFCFCTPSYRPMAEDGLKNWKEFGLDARIVDYEQQDWESSCCQRPILLAREANSKHAVGMLDCDIRFLQRPRLLENWEGDVLVHRTQRMEMAYVWSVGIVAFSPGIQGRMLLSRWADNCSSRKFRGQKCEEQFAFYNVMERTACTRSLLPNTYCFVPPREPKWDGVTRPMTDRQFAWQAKYDCSDIPDDTVVLHLPASRRMKAVVDEKAETPEPPNSTEGTVTVHSVETGERIHAGKSGGRPESPQPKRKAPKQDHEQGRSQEASWTGT